MSEPDYRLLDITNETEIEQPGMEVMMGALDEAAHTNEVASAEASE